MRSRLYRGGRNSPARERGVHHSHRLLYEFLRQEKYAAPLFLVSGPELVIECCRAGVSVPSLR